MPESLLSADLCDAHDPDVRIAMPNAKLSCQIYDGEIIQIDLPHTIDLEVVEAPPVVKGATATNQMKDVVLETGARVRVPPFIDAGERVIIDTRTGEYIERAK